MVMKLLCAFGYGLYMAVCYKHNIDLPMKLTVMFPYRAVLL